MNGLLIKTRLWGPDGMSIKRPESPIAASAIDIQCRNPGSAITGSITAGYAVVVLDWANYVLGRLPPIVVTDSVAPTTIPALGVIAPGQDSVGASGGLCWVRIWGYHPYVKVDGTTDVAVGDPLVLTSSNFKKFTAAEVICAFALAARTTNSVGPLACDLQNPYRFPVS